MTSIFLDHFDDLLSTPEDVELLNRAILQLAVQGKLVLQDLQDEPAEILYKRILKEKEQNLNGRTPRSLPLVSQDEIPFEIPNNWVWTRLGEISNYGEATKSRAIEFTDETWVLDLEDIEKTTSRLIQRVRLKDRQFQSDKNVFQKGDVIYGKLRPYLDKVIVADEDGICSSELIPIKTYGDINPFYLRLALKRPDFIDYVNGKTYGVKMPRLGTQDARMALVPLPPLAEQQRIVARVEELFAQTRALAKELAHSQIELDGLNKAALSHLLTSETLEEFNQHWDFIAEHFDLLFQAPEHIAPLRQSILELAVRGKLTRREAGDESANKLLKRIKDEKAKLVEEGKLRNEKPAPPIKEVEEPFELPDGWEWVRLKEITIYLQTGPFGSNLHKSDYVSDGIPVVNPVNMRDGKITINQGMLISQSTLKRLSQYILETGDLVLARRGEIGRCALVTQRENGWLCGTGSLRLRVSQNICNEYMVLLFKTDFARTRLTDETVGITMSNMSQTALENLTFALPSLAEQERIVKRVEQLLSLCDALEARLQSAEEERGRLVSAVMARVS